MILLLYLKKKKQIPKKKGLFFEILFWLTILNIWNHLERQNIFMILRMNFKTVDINLDNLFLVDLGAFTYVKIKRTNLKKTVHNGPIYDQGPFASIHDAYMSSSYSDSKV